MKVLFYINHFFGQNAYFQGKSSLPAEMDPQEIQKRADVRRKYVEQVIDQAKKIENADVRVCGIEGYSLVKLDITFDHVKNKPLWLIYESLNHMANYIEEYDYFINIEDDVFLPEETFNNIIEFDKTNFINEILLPNRLEKTNDNQSYCVDLLAIPGWTQQRKSFKGKEFQVALNSHSALVILSKEKLKYALKHLDKNFREPILHNELDSAFAYFHSPFALFRSKNIEFHSVIHLDKWFNSPGEKNDAAAFKNKLMTIGIVDFIPAIFIRVLRFTKRLIFR